MAYALQPDAAATAEPIAPASAYAGNILMTFRTNFRSKLLLLTIVPLAIAQIVTLFAVMNTVESDVHSRARESLVIGANVVDEFLSARAEQLRTSVAVLAADFGLKEATATGDRGTIASVLENHSKRVDANMAMLVDLDGVSLASTLDVPPGDAVNIKRMIDSAGNLGLESTAIISGRAYHIFVVPLRAPVTIGFIVFGFRIDEFLAAKLADLTGLDVSIVSADSADAYVIASTSDSLLAGKTYSDFLMKPGGSDAVYMADVPKNQSLTIVAPFVRGKLSVFVILQRSLPEAMVPYLEARRGLILFGAALLLFVAITGGLFSSTVAQPLRSLTDAAQRMISGDYASDVEVKSDDEFGDLAASFNAMRLAIAEREQRISHQALHNSLTDLPNRENILQQLSSVIESAREDYSTVAVLSIRIARMDEISSTLGHSATDELITLAAKHLRANLDASDCLGHPGSNEFVYVLKDHDIDDALACADRIARILDSGVSLDRVNISLQTHIGIAEYPRHGSTAAELLRFASIARTDALQSKEPVRVYQSGREDEFIHRLRVVNDLRSAIRRDELQVWYQPKAALPGGTICGAEALVRWHHPELGFLAPNDFVPAAEQAGTIVHLSRYVLGEAISQCRAWHDSGHALTVSVNLAARDLLDEYLPYHVLQLLKDNDVPAEQLTLEVTESSIMENLNQATLVLECLRDMGVCVSMDDFGTGHSSLSQLRAIPLDELKIDKSFVLSFSDNAQDEAIVRNTVELAHSMGLHVVAEGVEDEETMRRLANIGCEQAQGYFLCRPIPAIEIIAWLDAYKPTPYAERRGTQRAFGSQA